jgi:heme-degrading monooxygenase HmoA
MNARVVSIQIQPGKTNEAVSMYQDSVVPAAKQQKGFKSALLLTDPTTGKGFSVTVWETEANMTAGEASGYYQEQIAKFGAVIAAPPVREHYEVSVQA